MSENLFVFSFDNDEDALNTLTNYYQTTKKHIYSKLEILKELYSEYQNSNNQTLFLFAIKCCLNSGPLDIKSDRFKVYFYHRTGSDGTKEWFSKGLLNSKDGIASFVSNIHSAHPNLGIIDYENAMLAQDTQKHGYFYRKFGSKSLGPFAFYCKEDACALTEQRSFLDLPEIFYDVARGTQIYDDLRTKLHPTVVKFWIEKPIDYFDYFLLIYWSCILDENYEPGADVGRGQNIPFENIDVVITLPKN